MDEAGVSKKEFEHIKTLLALDAELFKPSEYGSFSPYSMIFDISKYEGVKLSKDVKEILYRPPKVKNLYEKYWQLVKVCENRELVENDREILTDYRPRFPRKTPEEIQIVDQILKRLDELVEEDKRELAKASFQTQAASPELMSELNEDGGLYYKGSGIEAIEKWRKMTDAER